MIKRSVIILFFIGIVTSVLSTQAGVVLPRMGAFIELDKVTPADPWEDRSSRVQWVLARLNCEGQRVYLLDPKNPKGKCEVFYFDGPAFTEILTGLPEGPVGILQSADRKLIEEGPVDRVVQVSPRVSLRFHKTGLRRVVTVSPGLSDCFNDEDAVRGLADAILWLAGLPENTPRGLIGPYLNYYDDLREALTRHQFRWFLDKDLPYPLNIPALADVEPMIDVSLKTKQYAPALSKTCHDHLVPSRTRKVLSE
jgi:hypothetical protein